MVDVGGYRVHVYAEGEAKGSYPLVTFGGGHSAALAMEHVHEKLRLATRSIMIDRSGTGWSDTGPIPHTTALEAEEVIAALEGAGEEGPFVFAGYSFGGLLVANIARRFPEKVARLVLIDATPLETIVFGPRFDAIRQMLRAALASGLLRLVGIHINFDERAARKNPAHAEAGRAFRESLGPALTKLREIEVTAGSQFANFSIYHELKGTHVGSVGWETVVYDGDLGDMEVWLVAPGDSSEVVAEPEVGNAHGKESVRMLNFFARSRERYMATSSNSKRVVAPEGTTHQFVYTHPDFIIRVLEDAVRLK
jgi:pimeloyl-ACP methyl ester carboxylesterase